ncbi:MAG TPA: glycosyltransferase, partial [Candidatus Limnocylindria bacterium]|nr:glycosyltransferase [Candidatus Limnocylindria bacterium]
MSYALVAYPLSADFRRDLEASVREDIEYLSVADLRQRSPLASLRALRARRGQTCYLPVEDPAAAALLPILGLAGAVGGASSLRVVDRDLKSEAMSTGSVLKAFLGVLGASVRNVLVAALARNELARLVRQPRADARLGSGQKVLYVNGNFWFGAKTGGSIGHVAGVVNALVASGHPVDLWSATEPVMVRPPARTFRLRAPSTFGIPAELNYYSFQRQMLGQIRREADRAGISFIYQRMSIANYAGVLLSRALGVPLVLEHNGSEVWIARKWGRPLRFERLAALAERVNLRHAHLVVTVSQVLRDEIVAAGVEPGRVVWHPNAIDPEIFDPARFGDADRAALRSRYGISTEDVVVTFVGTFGRWHGAEILADAVRRLVGDNAAWLASNRVRFLFVGDGVRMPEVRRTLDIAAAAPFVRFAGLVPQAEAPGYLAASDVVVAPHVPNADGSPFFGSPTKLFEYMAMGKAVV